MLEQICPEAAGWQLERELSLLGVDSGALERPFCTLSNGEQTKVLLAALFLNEGHFLLIDEPTNHLDAKARAMVAAYLQKKQGFILVSHDRRFLDGCVDHILSLNRATIQLQSGNYSSWQTNFDQQQARELAQNQKLQKDIQRLEASARRTSVWADRVEASKRGAADKGYVGHKAAKMMKRAKSVEARQTKAIQEKSGLLKDLEETEPLRITPLAHHAPVLAAFQDVSVCYDGRTVCGPVRFEIRQGERIALCGSNGCGKSSLLKLLCDADIPHTGTVTTAPGLVISQVPQDAAGLSGSLDQFAQDAGIDQTLFKAILRKMDFSRLQFEKDMAGYSSGQKKKVLLARSLCQQAHLYVWDEPLNFIDLYTRLQLEQLLGQCKAGRHLVFVGDGVNDAPVLSRADIGIAMGALGSDAAIEAADIVLMDDDPARIALAIQISRRTCSIVYQNIVFALGVKALCLILGALGLAGMWLAIFADVGVMVLAVLNATRALYTADLVRKAGKNP